MKKLLTFFLLALLTFGVGWAEELSDVLNQTFTGITGTSYSNFSNTGSSGTAYDGNCAGGNSSIQLRSSNNNSGIVTTSSVGKVKSIQFTFNSNTTNGRIVDVYGKNTAYTSAADLYNTNAQGTKIGSATYNGSSLNVTVNVTGDYQYIGFRSYSGALYLTMVRIVWETGGSTTLTCADPVFDPDGGIFTGSASVTITSATEGATIYYTTDGTDPVVNRSSIANGGTVELTEGGTIKAMAVKSGMENSNIVTSQAYTINPAGGGGSGPFTLVTDASTLEAGDEIIFVSSGDVGSADAMSTTQNSNSRGVAAVTVTSSKTVSATDETQIFTLQGGTGAWYFYTGSGYIYAASSSSNHLKTEDVADDNAKATISISNGGEATVVFQGTNTRNNLRYNGSNNPHIYSCYAGTTTQAKPFIYRRSGVPSTDPRLEISPESQTISDAAPASLTITGENINGNINTSLASNTDWYLNPTSFGNEGGTASLTYTGRALSASNTVTATASGATSVSATVNYIADLYIVTDNGSTGNWDFNNGTPMANNDGVYTATFTAPNPNTFILFARKTGDGVNWNTRYVFGPNSNGDWWLDSSGNGGGNIDLYDDDPIKIQGAGIYTVTIDANAGTFTITKQNINVTITPADGTHFTGSTISGTITSDPAGTIEWSTDGNNWQAYTDGFTATVDQVGGSVTVYARSTSNGVTSDVVSATYTRDLAPAPEAPSFSIGSSAVAAGTVITITAPEGCTLYVNGEQVSNPYDVTINSATSITAYCVNDEGTQSTTVTNSYTIATVCNAIIEFKDNGSDDQDATSWSAMSDYFEAGKDYLDGASGISRVFKGTTGLKFGNSSNGGTITFSLDNETEWKVSHITLNAKSYNGNNVTFTVSTDNGQSETTSAIGSNLGGYTLDFDDSAITSITISASARAYLKGFTITYDCAPVVEAPVIKPHTGTYYYGQNVVITAAEGTTIHYTTDGSEPTIDSDVYSGSFWPAFIPGRTYTVKAIAVDGNGNISPVSTATYTWATPSVTITPGSKDVAASSVTVMLTSTPPEANIYYTTDGSNPTTGSLEYIDAFSVNLPEVGDQVTVKAIAVVNDYYFSEVASATYTRVEKVIDVNAPFFSPLENQTYYGAQTLQIASTTLNADIYYEIVEVDGTTAPAASTVDDPTKASTHYDGTPINLTVGKSYYVKAIAYVGDFASAISEGWYTIKSTDEFEGESGVTYVANIAEFNALGETTATVGFMNPVQVVFMSTYQNDGETAEFCYIRDNSDYGCVYFGKNNTTYHRTIFKMGDWIDGTQVRGLVNVWENNFHNQMGSSDHSAIKSWPSTRLDWSEIIPETTTTSSIASGTAEGDNLWGHYVHLRYTSMSNVAADNDGKYKGSIVDETGANTYYDKFYRWSGLSTSLGNYNQAFFNGKAADGATFDVYGIVDYYKPDSKPFQVCPIDFLWAYKPVITPASNYQCTSQQEVEITVQTPEWTTTAPTIYYKTDVMDDWAVYTGPILVNSDTHIEAYAAIPAVKTDGTNYNDVVLSDVVSADYEFVGIEEPSIDPGNMVIELDNGGFAEPIEVTVTDHNEPGSGAVTLVYLITQDETMDGFDPYDPEGAHYTVSAGEECILDERITRNTTVLAISYVVVDGEYLWSNPVTATYTFVGTNGIEYNLVKTTPQPGYVYVIVNKDANMGMSTTQNYNNRGSVGVLFKEDTNRETVYGNEDLAQFVLESTNGGRYYFKNINGGGYLVVTTNEVANLSTNAEASVYSEASVAIGSQDAGYPATITFNYDGTNRYLRYFANGRTFSTHSSASINEDVFLYGAEATPLAYIESSVEEGSQVIVSDELIATWSVVNPETGEKFLWAKDQGNLSIDKRPAIDYRYQSDYVKNILGYGADYEYWDESNWVILDFAGIDANPDDYVGFKIKAGTVAGQYTDDVNYRIMLGNAPSLSTDLTYQQDAPEYPGWEGPFADELVGSSYNLGYNSYVPANFMVENHNHYDSDGNVVGFVADETALPGLAGDQLYFMNPKIQEVAHIWAVWCGDDDATGEYKNLFSVYRAEHKPNENINAWNLNGTFRVKWDYNCKNRASDPHDNIYGRATGLVEGVAYEFHAAIFRPTDNRPNSLRADGEPEPQGSLNEGTPSPDYVLYPLDIKDGGTWTAVVEKNAPKAVVGVSYYNLMGVESKKPFDGVNIVVTRYSDGSTSTTKVLR